MAKITIFHTSDMHNKLTRECADKLHALKSETPGSLMFDCGDAIWSGNIFWRPGGEPVLELMNSVPYDAMCIGNREYHFLGVGMSAKVSRADFPLLSANLRPNRNGRLHAKPYITFEIAGVKIAVMGLSVPCITEKMLVKNVSDYYFEQPLKTAKELVPELRPKCDLLIALTHIGIAKDRELAQKVEGIDLILGGHTHTVTDQPEQVGNTSIIHSGFYAHYVGKIVAEVDSGQVRITNELIPLAKA